MVRLDDCVDSSKIEQFAHELADGYLLILRCLEWETLIEKK